MIVETVLVVFWRWALSRYGAEVTSTGRLFHMRALVIIVLYIYSTSAWCTAYRKVLFWTELETKMN